MEKLTKQEEEVMMLFWQLGKSCYIRDVMDIYPEPKPPYTSVASTVKNLQRKGYLDSKAKVFLTSITSRLPKTNTRVVSCKAG